MFIDDEKLRSSLAKIHIYLTSEIILALISFIVISENTFNCIFRD